MRTKPFGLTLLLGTLAITCGCNAFDDPQASGPRAVRVVPTDERAPLEAEVSALPVSGGTLLSLGTSGALVASDPARDRVSVTQDGTVSEIPLPQGSQPWRMTQIDGTTVAVSLRGSGKVVALDVTGEGDQVWEARVCAAPRGLDFELSSQQVHVACAGGELVSLDSATGEELARVFLASDLRDVVAADGRVYVSRFRSAEVLFVENGQLERQVTLPSVKVVARFSEIERNMKPTVAWRMQALKAGGVAIVHQRATVDEVPIELEEAEDQDLSSSPYGGGGGSGSSMADCTSIVQTSISRVDSEGAVLTGPSLAGVVLPVDFAVSASGTELVIADAGLRDPSAPRSRTEVLGQNGGSRASFPDLGVRSSVVSFQGLLLTESTPPPPLEDGGNDVVGCVGGEVRQVIDGPSSAVVFQGDVLSVLSTREATLTQAGNAVALGGAATVDTGHDIFHRDTGGGIACASCHPEGTDDGHVWVFTDLGPRRTQNLAIPLAETAPFHWDGELDSVSTLMDEVFVVRMGGAFQSQERLDALQGWLFSALKPVHLGEMDAAAERGKALFDSDDIGCATCHNGGALTDNNSYLVGTSKVPLQVPSLVGVAAHPPFMHDGCAKTLEARFDPECGGGDAHGRTSQLSQAEIGDLVAYMRTL